MSQEHQQAWGPAPTPAGPGTGHGGEPQPYPQQQAYAPQQPYPAPQAYPQQQPYAAQQPHPGHQGHQGQPAPEHGQPVAHVEHVEHGHPGGPGAPGHAGPPQPYEPHTGHEPHAGHQVYGSPQAYGSHPPYRPAGAYEPAPYPQSGAVDQPTMALPRQAPAGVPAPAPAAAPFAPAPPVPPTQAPPAPAAAGHRTGSPIIEPGLQPALITAGTAALLAGGAAVGVPALAVVVALLQVLTAAGWFRLNGMWPARQGIALAALAGFTADAAVLLAGRGGGAAAVVGTLGGFFLLVLVLQTFRPSDPAERFYALTVLGSATVVTVLCGALLLADWVPAAVGAVALATLLAAAPLPGPKQLGPVLGVVAAAVFGLAVGAPPALGVLAGVGALVGRRVAAYDWPSRFVHMTAGVALPLAVSAPLVWLATGLLAG